MSVKFVCSRNFLFHLWWFLTNTNSIFRNKILVSIILSFLFLSLVVEMVWLFVITVHFLYAGRSEAYCSWPTVNTGNGHVKEALNTATNITVATEFRYLRITKLPSWSCILMRKLISLPQRVSWCYICIFCTCYWTRWIWKYWTLSGEPIRRCAATVYAKPRTRTALKDENVNISMICHAVSFIFSIG